jgi:glycosyltransferase involved in cell wall biosynthesis
LRDRVLEFFPSARVLVLEEPIDIERVKPLPSRQTAARPFIVWSGHFNSQPELLTALQVLDRVHGRFPFTLRILSRKPQDAPSFAFPVEWIPYDGAREAEMLSGAVAGIAPLEDTQYARCKGGYKVKTYFAAGIPVVASPVGHHSRTIRHCVDGFLAATPAEWEEALSRLLRNAEFRQQMGTAARQSAVQKLSHDVLMPQWAEALREALPVLRG